MIGRSHCRPGVSLGSQYYSSIYLLSRRMGQSYYATSTTLAKLLPSCWREKCNLAEILRECSASRVLKWTWANCAECGPVVMIWLFQCAADIACWGYISWAAGFGIVSCRILLRMYVCIYIMCPRKCCSWRGLLIVQCVKIRIMIAAGWSMNAVLTAFNFCCVNLMKLLRECMCVFISRSGLNPRPLTQIPWINTRMGDLPSIRFSVHITYHPWSSQACGNLGPSLWGIWIWIGAGRLVCVRSSKECNSFGGRSNPLMPILALHRLRPTYKTEATP